MTDTVHTHTHNDNGKHTTAHPAGGPTHSRQWPDMTADVKHCHSKCRHEILPKGGEAKGRTAMQTRVEHPKSHRPFCPWAALPRLLRSLRLSLVCGIGQHFGTDLRPFWPIPGGPPRTGCHCPTCPGHPAQAILQVLFAIWFEDPPCKA